MENKHDYGRPPKKPEIRKLGTIACDLVETTPVVFKGELYRFEYVRPHRMNGNNPSEISYMQFVNVRTDKRSVPFAKQHHLGAAFADDANMYVSAVASHWGGSEIHIFRSADLNAWELYGTFDLGDDHGYNTGICKKDGRYILLVEVEQPTLYSFIFAESADLKTWNRLSPEHIFQKGRYAGGPAIYTVDDDPYYYVGYLEACPMQMYVNCIARSRDLMNWEYSPFNPVLMFEPEEDKKIANPFLSPDERARIARAWDINNSDMEICEFLGRTVIYYSWGNQNGIEFLAEACFEGTKKEFLEGFFPPIEDKSHITR